MHLLMDLAAELTDPLSVALDLGLKEDLVEKTSLKYNQDQRQVLMDLEAELTDLLSVAPKPDRKENLAEKTSLKYTLDPKQVLVDLGAELTEPLMVALNQDQVAGEATAALTAAPKPPPAVKGGKEVPPKQEVSPPPSQETVALKPPVVLMRQLKEKEALQVLAVMPRQTLVDVENSGAIKRSNCDIQLQKRSKLNILFISFVTNGDFLCY